MERSRAIMERSMANLQSRRKQRHAWQTCGGERGGAQQEVGAGAADEAHDIVGGLQVVPEANILVVQHIIRPVHTTEHL